MTVITLGSQSHSETKLHGAIKNENGGTIWRASDEGLTYVLGHVFIYPAPELAKPAPGLHAAIYHPHTPGIGIIFAICLALFFISQ